MTASERPVRVGKTYRTELPSLFTTQDARYEPSLHEHPPYSVLDAAGGWWQKRRAYWRALGCRDAGPRPTVIRRGPTSASEQSGNVEAVSDESQFSPVLAELILAFYSAPDDLVVDPFCGGPIRGYVAKMMTRRYVGFDVRREQIAANNDAYPRLHLWWVGDARDVILPRRAKLVITCPPYGDVERYSDQANDLSTLPWSQFVQAHGEAVARSTGCLEPGGFAVWVVGDFRGPNGELRRFPDLVASQLEEAGLTLWNRHIVRHPLVTAPMRWRRQWDASAKATTVHSEVLVARRP